MSRDRFMAIKKAFHLPAKENERDRDSGNTDRFGKVRYLIDHCQVKFAKHFVPEQQLSHDESMVRYFGKHGLKQSILNKPIRFGFKAWCLCTTSGYVVTFDFYQGRGVGVHHADNVKAVGAAGATLLDLIDLLPDDKVENISYHFFADNYFTSHKLVDVLVAEGHNYTGTIRKDRVKGNPDLTPVDKFKKAARGAYQTCVLDDKSQVITRWNDNAPVTLLSSLLGDQPLCSATRFSRQAKKKVEVPQPDVVKKYNSFMGGVDRFDQNQNHLRVTIGGKKWYWSPLTWMLDAAVNNAWQLSRKAGGNKTLLEFKRELVSFKLRQVAGNRLQLASRGLVHRVGDDIRYDNGPHLIVIQLKERKTCAMEGCKTRCQTRCNRCERAICVHCFKDFHTK